MKRITSLGIGVVLIAALAIPAAPAAAHHGKRGHKAGHHVRFHKRGHHRLTISDNADKHIGTIASFDATTGTLTIKLDGGKTVEGTVNPDTEIKCVPAPTGPTPAPTVARSSHFGGDDEGDDDGGDKSGSGSYPGSGDYPGGSGQQGHCNHGDKVPCTTADLVVGAVVREAEVKVTADGLVFDEIKIVKAAA